MTERIADLQTRVQRARAALQALAERAAELRARLESAGPNGHGGVVSHSSALAESLDRLTQSPGPTPQVDAGGDGEFLSDAWEIALINEEGK